MREEDTVCVGSDGLWPLQSLWGRKEAFFLRVDLVG